MTRPNVTVRMYKGLLGDCFLLRLFNGNVDGGRERVADAHILIDCGVIQRAPQERERIMRVAEDIRDSCGNHLDLVVVTHEHYDHLSGFGTASDIFLEEGGLEIDKLWLGWTEKPGDAQAERLRQLSGETRMAIAAGVQQMAARAPQNSGRDWELDGEALGLDGFIGPLDFGIGGRLSGREILEKLKERIKPDDDDYLEPGQAKQTPGNASLRAFVLGPPRNEERLFKDLPSQAVGKRETYLAARESEVRATARNFARRDDMYGLDSFPFSKRHQQISDAEVLDAALPAPVAAHGPFYRNLWDIRGRYLEPKEEWRRIDTDWHGPIGALALKLDSDTNNTSLVLAFETEPSGDIMLFAADAQVGNWLSWHDQQYPKDAPVDERSRIEDLLARVVLYKVGHHASHNATLSVDGLELMTHHGLVAMIPVVEDWAQRRRWPMPYDKLYERMREKTSDRILRGDAPPFAHALTAQPDFARRVREKPDNGSGLGPLWVEYDIC